MSMYAFESMGTPTWLAGVPINTALRPDLYPAAGVARRRRKALKEDNHHV